MKRLTLLTIALLMFLTGCAIIGGGRYRSYKRLQGEWKLDTYWTSQRADAYAKSNWGDPRTNERAREEFNNVLNAADRVSFVFDKKYVTIRSGRNESKSRWGIMSYDGRDDSILLRKLGEDRQSAHTHRRMSPQELVNLLAVEDGDLPHVLGIRFLDSRHIEFFTLKVIAGKVSDYRNATGLQVYSWSPLPKKQKKKPTATPRPTPTPTPVIVKAIVQPTPIPRFRVPPMVPIMDLPEIERRRVIQPAPAPEAEPAPGPEVSEGSAPVVQPEPVATPRSSSPIDLNAPVGR